MGVQTAWAQTSGTGTQADPYIIANSTDLNTFGSKMNNNTQYWKLSADIDLGGAEWTYGKNSASNFKGHFDGNGKTIKNFKIVPTSAKNNGFFTSLQGTATSRAEVKNLIIDNVTILQSSDLANTTITGALAGNVTEYTDIDSVSVKNVSITFNNLTNTNYVGGFVGRVEKNNSKITRCSVVKPTINVTGEIKGGASYIGGAIGLFAGSAKLLSTIDSLVVSSPSVTTSKNSVANSYIGGVFGQINKYCTINKVTASKPTLTYSNTDAPNVALYLGTLAGGIIGTTDQKVAVTNVKVTDDVKLSIGSSNDVKNVKAGLIGQINTNVSLDTWTVSGDSKITINGNLATSTSYIGGFIGYATGAASGPLTIKNVTFEKTSTVSVSGATKDATSYLGGLIGYVISGDAADTDITIDSITVKGTTSMSIAGVIGNDVLNNKNAYERKGNVYVGGFAGNVQGRAKTNNKVDVNHVTLGDVKINILEEVHTGSYFGGLVGCVNTSCQLDSLSANKPSLIFEKDITQKSYVGGALGRYVSAASYPSSGSNIKVPNPIITFKGKTVDMYAGGLVGEVSTNCELKDLTVDTPVLTFKDQITAASYVGSAIGNFTGGAATTMSTLDNITVKKPTLTIKEITVKDGCYGNVFGRINNYSTVDKVTLTEAKFDYQSANLGVSTRVGTVVGYIVGNAAKKTSVTNVTIDKSELTFGTSTASNIAGLYAGIIGYVNTAVSLDTWKVTGASSIKINGNLTTTTSYLGGFMGYSSSGGDGPVDIKNIETGDTISINVTGKISVASYIGGLIGQTTQANNDKNQTIISNIEAKKAVVISVDGDIATGSYLGGFAGYIYSRSRTGCSSTIKQVTLKTSDIAVTGKITAGSYIGGLIGYATTGCDFNDLKITSDAKITLKDNITATSYVSGAIARFDGTASYPSTATALNINKPTISINGNVTNTLYLGGLVGYQTISTLKGSSVTGGDITINGNSTTALYVGGAVGWMNPTVSPYALVQQVEVKKTKIHSSGTHTYAKGNKPLVVGGVVGYMGQSATTFTEVRNCVADSVEIDFSSMIPEAGNTKESLYNQQQNAFVIGGVIGRINTPSRLPESLFYSGKINAPFAMVAPIVGVFFTKIDAAAYLYDDYVGTNATYLTTSEWEKTTSWYYNNYKIGLSQALLDETARTKNYVSAGVVTEDGIKYLDVKDDTFAKSNVINGIDKSSYTVLAYNQTGKDVDFGISPAWNTNATTYPAYYMYYMQGVNHGQYVSDAIEQLKKDILEGMGALIDLVLVDNNGDFTIAANRGVVDHKMKVTPSGEVDSYKWYVDGNLQSATSDAFTYHPSPKGNDILVEAYKNGVCCKRVRYTIKSVLRVKDVSVAIYGTKANPYLIGNAEDLQLLSYLSSLPATIAWDTKGYKSNDHYNRAYYELDNDIDMSSVDDFTPISFPSANSTDGNYGGYDQNIVFDGVLDGKFHTIKNLRETWHSGSFDINDMNVGWGLFSYVGNSSPKDKVGDAKDSKLPAKICNLFIDGAVLTHKANNTSFAYNGTEVANNCMVGVLAGIVSSNTIIENIEIRNSKITDDGSWEYSLATKGLYVGGVIGSMQKALNATGDSPVNSKVDHVAANVDISLNNAAFADNGAVEQLGQFNVGGIVGRYVATGHNQTQVQPSLPAYVFYSGDITAPKAWISPVLAALRYKDNNAVNIFANYSKQWEGNNNTEATQIAITNAHYYNFKIEGKKVTDFYPDNTCSWNARSIAYHENGAGSAETYNAKMYQGVNFGALWVDEDGCSLKTLNENIVDGVYWVWDNGFVHMSETPCIEAYLTFKENEEGTGADVTAVMTDESTGSYRWMQSFDGENWFEVEGITENIYSSVYINKPKVVVAYVTVDGVEYRTQPLLLQAVNILYSPYLTTTGNETDGYWYNVAWNGKAPTNSFVVSYQWFESDEKTQFVGQTDSKLYLGKKAVDDAGGVVWCKINIQYMGADVNKYFVKSYPVDATVVFVDGTNGIDNVAGSQERGWKPETPVKTIDHANSLLKTIDEHGTWDNNIIVVMGTLNPNPSPNTKDTYRPFQSRGSNPATITGNYNSVDYGGKIILAQWNPNNSDDYNNIKQGDENDVNPVWTKARGANCYVLHDTKFENLTFEANIQTDGNNFIECHGHDVTFGKGLVVTGFQKLSQAHGNFKKAAIVPELTIVLTATNLNQVDIDKYTKNRTKPQVVTFQSGHYGRILGGRYTNGFFSKATNTSHSILASAENPIWAIVNIDIDPENSNEGEIYDPDTKKIVNTYSHDINAVIAGLTDGSMYGDYTINYHGGSVSYIVGGNQGNPVANGTLSFTPDEGTNGEWGQWPNASYFGRTVINVEQDPMCKNISVGNLYAGGLGREANGSNAKSIVDMYYYGHTEVNIKSGTVGNVYAGGAGGVMGINPWDAHLPYATETEGTVEANAIMNKVQYGDTRRGTWSSMVNGNAPIVKVTLHNLNETGDGYVIVEQKLDNTYTTVNIMGGTVNGNVYGGGYGFVQDMPAEVTMQGIGSVFGDAYINISGGAISGSVYGGSQGHAQFYNKENKYGQTITHIAEMNGTVNINITGNDEQCPTIGGNIYGGGQGLVSSNGEEYLRIATCGNTELGEQYKAGVNITIDLPENVPFAGNIYGGGQLGMLEGDTNILIKRGTFTGNIFGGGKGEDNHPDKAKVIGTTNVKIGE